MNSKLSKKCDIDHIATLIDDNLTCIVLFNQIF